MKAIGIILILFYMLIVSIMSYMFLYDIVASIYIMGESYRLEAIALLSVFSWCVFNLVFNYFMAVFTDPGSLEDTPENNRLQERIRVCGRCHYLKPERAHHCSVCGRCILKFDHHCPWICNCVGYYNHRYFLLFISYTLFGLVVIIFGDQILKIHKSHILD